MQVLHVLCKYSQYVSTYNTGIKDINEWRDTPVMYRSVAITRAGFH